MSGGSIGGQNGGPVGSDTVLGEALVKFRERFGREPEAAACAPGRVEVLGNHTDYNEGFVLSAAIDFRTCFLAAPAGAGPCRLVAGDIMEESVFPLPEPRPDAEHPWANYAIGMAAQLAARLPKRRAPSTSASRPGRPHESYRPHGPDPFLGLFFGNVPLGAGLSSSAALEMSAGLALASLWALDVEPVDMARMGQRAEHEFAGARTGLLDQISSLFGQSDRLVLTDFRSLEVRTVPLGEGLCLLLCDTGVKHALVESAYNDRRASCERAAELLARWLDHPVSALRDVSVEQWERLETEMDPETAKRARHVIGENRRVLDGIGLLESGRVEEFGELMFESHESSRVCFENSCPELDHLVETARGLSGVLGARLSGGGFGGSVVVLLDPARLERIRDRLEESFRRAFGRRCRTVAVHPADGARVVDLSRARGGSARA